MSTTTEPPPTNIDQIWGGFSQEEQLHRDIDAALYALNGNSDRVERMYSHILPGRTHQDRIFIAKIFRHMFGLKRAAGMITSQPLHPEFPYVGACRHMSRADLKRLLKKQYRNNCPTHDQFRRIFEAFCRAGLLTMSKQDVPDAEGQFKRKAQYTFNLEVWRKLWEEAKKPLAFKPPGKGGKKTPTTSGEKPAQTAAGKPGESVQVPSEEKPAAIAFFECEPKVISNPCSELKGGSYVAGPGERGQEGISPKQEEKIGSPQGDGAAAPGSSLSSGKAGIPISYTTPASMKPYERFLVRWLDATIGTGWQRSAWDTDNFRPGFTLKQRIPDCQVVAKPIGRLLLGVYNFLGHHLPLTPEELEIGDLVERASGCPLRLSDWKLLHSLFNGKARTRLTKDRLLLVLYVTCRNGLQLDFMANWAGAEPLTISHIVPELDHKNFGEYTHLLYDAEAHSETIQKYLHDETTDNKDRKHRVTWDFPFLNCEEVSPSALLSPDNAGRMLLAFRHYWTRLIPLILPERQVRDAQGKVLEDRNSWSCTQVMHHTRVCKAEAKIGMSPAALPEALATICETFRVGDVYYRTDLWAVFTTAKKIGLDNLSADVSSLLTEAALHVFTRLPHFWCELDASAELGGNFMARLMPLRNFPQLRAKAQERTLNKLKSEWIMPYAQFSPTAARA